MELQPNLRMRRARVGGFGGRQPYAWQGPSTWWGIWHARAWRWRSLRGWPTIVPSWRVGYVGLCIPRDHGAAGKIKVVRITIELNGRLESTRRVHPGVQVHDVRENGRKGGNNSFLGWECKEPNVVGKVINCTE
jgi:hypothetical protein